MMSSTMTLPICRVTRPGWRGCATRNGVVRLRFGSTTGIVLLRHADVSNAFRDDSRYSKSEAVRPSTFPFMGPNIMGYDGHEHTVKRSLVNHLAFGIGRHFCLGAFLARGELNVGLEVLLRRLPNLRLLEDPVVVGIVLRGPKTLRMRWDAP
jgi:2-hydroxy-5-methyl-1-naphthoate 7-hydroxylase